ncbi:MAG: phospholipase D-like domain-containing protein [Halothiobacillaceae bacterium]
MIHLILSLLAVGLLLAWILTAIWHVYKPIPDGLDVATPWVPAAEVTFLADTSYLTEGGERGGEQAIFDAVFDMITAADRLLVLDMFLFNNFAGTAETVDYRPLSQELGQALVQQRHRHPDMEMLLITDPVNTVYGSLAPDHLQQLQAAGVPVIQTDLSRLRDSNPLWSGLWRLCCRWLDTEPGKGWLPNPMTGPPVSLVSWMRLLNFKANHRKTIIANHGEEWIGLVTSANPHDASSRHDNVALRFVGPAALDLLATEQSASAIRAITRSNRNAKVAFEMPASSSDARESHAGHEGHMRILTEAQIRVASIELIDASQPGEQLDLAMFYLSHRGVIKALKRAAARGVAVRALLDANHDAFGREKSGLPNRPVGMELQQADIKVRWCLTSGEQCHTKLLMRRQADGSGTLLLGSANFTRRNLDNFNMETNVEWQAPAGHPASEAAANHFERRWNNDDGERHSLPFADYADDSWWRYWRYRLMEATGLSTF